MVDFARMTLGDVVTYYKAQRLLDAQAPKTLMGWRVEDNGGPTVAVHIPRQRLEEKIRMIEGWLESECAKPTRMSEGV